MNQFTISPKKLIIRWYLRNVYFIMLGHLRKLIKEVIKKKCSKVIFFTLFYFSLKHGLLTSILMARKSTDYHRTSIDFNIITVTEYLQFKKENSYMPDDFLEEWTNECFRVGISCVRVHERKWEFFFRRVSEKCFYNFMDVWGKADDGMKKYCLHISFLGHLTRERENKWLLEHYCAA